MSTARRIAVLAVPMAALLASGCGTPTVDFTSIERPARAAELEAYDVFVGEWTWAAEMVNADPPDKLWAGTAKWEWALSDRCLHGTVTAKSASAEFNAAGIWSWHPQQKKYIWWMFNDWGYPQQGTAKYDSERKAWSMAYTSVGLDGTLSYGEYSMKVIDKNTLEWTANEWMNQLHWGPKKMEMKGIYKRKG